ncbi:MAG: hypothetical protein KAV87_25175 [Desulfobacteraceae bacterium]|nr:hypothetical protein [Desulfobacteraceae bacterium]
MSIKMNLIVGADDIATGGQECAGWTYFILPERFYFDFIAQAKAILAKTILSTFHGKEYKPRFKSEYGEFLKLIMEFSKKSPQSLAMNMLLSRKCKTEFEAFSKRVIAKSYKNAGISNNKVVNAIQQYVTPLFSLLRATQSLGPNLAMQVELDNDIRFEDLDSFSFTSNNKTITAKWLLGELLNAYRNKCFPNSPIFNKNIVTSLDDENSVMVQAADVMGNFSMAYTFVQLGKVTEGRKQKAILMKNIFGKYIDKFDFSKHMKVKGEDIQLNSEGYLDFHFGGVTD